MRQRPQERNNTQKITIDSVCKQIYRRNGEVIDSAVSKGIPMLPYDFKLFEADVLADDFIASPRTALAKWKGLMASGIVVEKANRTLLDVGEVRQRCERRAYA